MKLIVNADDFGYTPGISNGIIHGYKNGIITSTTVLTNIPDIEEDCLKLLELDNIGIGLHLNLTLEKPLTNGKTIQDNTGYFYDRKHLLFDQLDLIEVETEFRAQINQFIKLFNRLPDHLDSHHSIHDHPVLLSITQKLMQEYNLPARRLSSVTFIGQFFAKEITPLHLISILKSNSNEDCIEIMCHPGFNDNHLEHKSSYNKDRQNELETLCSPDVIEYIKKEKIELTHYGKI